MAATTVSSLRAVSLKAEKADLSSKSVVSGVRVAKAAPKAVAKATVCQIEDQEAVSRRAALSLFAVAAAAAASSSAPAFAAYGDKANVFGKQTADSGKRSWHSSHIRHGSCSTFVRTKVGLYCELMSGS